MKKTALLCLILSACMALTACSPKIESSNLPSVTLAPALSVYQPPDGDEQRKRIETVLLYLPAKSTQQLAAVPVKMSLPPNRHPAETVLSRLFSFTGDEVSEPVAKDTEISLYAGRPVEISGNTATVNLDASALALNTSAMEQLCRAITNTLCQWGDIQYVNVLVADKQTGVDIASSLPMGSLRKTKNEESLWEKQAPSGRFTLNATLYYPALLGKGVMAETRAVTFSDSSHENMVESLLVALSSKESTDINTCVFPGLMALLKEDISVSTSTAGGGEEIFLSFLPEANGAFINAGIPRSVMVASITLTLTTFLPNIAGIRIQIGDETISALAPTGLVTGKRQMEFENGLIRRRDFPPFITDQIPVYYANERGKLQKTLVTVPSNERQNVRYIFDMLTQDTDQYLSARGIRKALAGGVSASDLIGYTMEGDTLLLNMSNNFSESFNSLSIDESRLAIYSIVNTMCELRGIRRVRFFISGEQPENFSDSIFLPGEFIRNPGMVN